MATQQVVSHAILVPGCIFNILSLLCSGSTHPFHILQHQCLPFERRVFFGQHVVEPTPQWITAMSSRAIIACSGRIVRFGDCLLDCLTPGRKCVDELHVNLHESHNVEGVCTVSLELSKAPSALQPGHNALPLGHAPECPTRSLSADSQWPRRHPHMSVAVVALLVNHHSDGGQSILLTRRPRHMRTFPGAWVLPGGAVDWHETLAEATAREVAEETGLIVEPHMCRPVGLWESVYPTCSSAGVPTSHSLVVYHQVDVMLRETCVPVPDNRASTAADAGKGTAIAKEVCHATRFGAVPAVSHPCPCMSNSQGGAVFFWNVHWAGSAVRQALVCVTMFDPPAVVVPHVAGEGLRKFCCTSHTFF